LHRVEHTNIIVNRGVKPRQGYGPGKRDGTLTKWDVTREPGKATVSFYGGKLKPVSLIGPPAEILQLLDDVRLELERTDNA
jgi:hypothetical protein